MCGPFVTGGDRLPFPRVIAVTICLHFGRNREFRCECDTKRITARHSLPRPVDDFAVELRSMLRQPLDFPPLAQCVVPGDQIVLAVDRSTPQAADVVLGAWEVLSAHGIEATNITILQPAILGNGLLVDPRNQLPPQVRAQVEWIIHDPTDEDQQAYLGTTAVGERVYLARRLVDADFVMSIGEIGYDPVLGYRGTNSVFYPGLSTVAAFQRTRGQGHSELGPDDERPLRQMIEEVAWLLGTQISIQVVPAGRHNAMAVLTGAVDSVFRRGKELLAEHWRLSVPERAEVVVAAVGLDAGGHGWEQVGAAIANARRIVARGGKIVILSELAIEPGDGLQILAECRDPRDAITPLREQAPLDLIPALQIADALAWADIYLLSDLRSETVENLHLHPLVDVHEVARLIDATESCILLDGAQHVYGCVEAS